jgi:desulfoferrodoxin (superoxide reductase-like protein)
VLVVEKKGVRVIRLAIEHPMNHYITWVNIVLVFDKRKQLGCLKEVVA